MGKFEAGISELLDAVIQAWQNDFDWMGADSLPKGAHYALEKRLKSAITERVRCIYNPYVEELEQELESAESRIAQYEQRGAVQTLQQTIENRDLLIKHLIGLLETDSVALTERELSNGLSQTLVLSNKDGNISVQVVNDEDYGI